MQEVDFLERVKEKAVEYLRNKGIFEDIIQEIYGGKMIRPRTIFAIASALGEVEFERLVPLAAATELVHLASLFHDDVIDNGVIRRGRPTINARYGNIISILAGDYFYSVASRLVLDSYPSDVPKIYSSAVSYMTLMELRQASLRWELNISREEYFRIIQGKTGALFSASLESVGLIAGRCDSERLHLREAGMLFGEIFQLTDDLLDFIGNKTGKSRLKDLIEGDITLPAILAMEKDSEVANLIRRYFSSKGENKEALKEIEQIITKDTSFVKEMLAIINEKRGVLISHLNMIQGIEADRFISLVDAVIERQN